MVSKCATFHRSASTAALLFTVEFFVLFFLFEYPFERLLLPSNLGLPRLLFLLREPLGLPLRPLRDNGFQKLIELQLHRSLLLTLVKCSN